MAKGLGNEGLGGILPLLLSPPKPLLSLARMVGLFFGSLHTGLLGQPRSKRRRHSVCPNCRDGHPVRSCFGNLPQAEGASRLDHPLFCGIFRVTPHVSRIFRSLDSLSHGSDAYGSLSFHAGAFLLACLSFYGSHSRTLQCLRYFREPPQLQVLDRCILASYLGRERQAKLLPFRVWSPYELLHLFRGMVVKTRNPVLALEEVDFNANR